MPIPTGGDTPSRYKPNPVDDRALTGMASGAYLALATAIEQTEVIQADAKFWNTIDKNTQKAIRTAESALRRAAFGLVLHAPDKQ
jgi:hypothetical protein